MRVLHLLSVKNRGGAANAAVLLNKKLIDNKIISEILFIDDLSERDFSNKCKRIIRKRVDDFPHFFYRKRKILYFTNSYLKNKKVEKRIKYLNPDILHVHWIGNGNFSLRQLKKLKIPIIWTMHDEWIYTGGCHKKISCERLDKQCGRCPILVSKKEMDLSKINYKLKKRIITSISNISFIAPSKWIEEESKKSDLIKNKEIYQVPNIFDDENFKKLDKINSRIALNLPINNTLILIGSVGIQSDEIKGFKYIKQVFDLLKDQQTLFAVFGNETNFSFEGESQVRTILSFGHISEVDKINQIYSSADIFLFPSLLENLSYVIIESIFSGTPVVAFDVGGNSELITHKVNGYLAKPYDIADLVAGIQWVLKNDLKQKMQKAENKLQCENYNDKKVLKRIINVYKNSLSKQYLEQ